MSANLWRTTKTNVFETTLASSVINSTATIIELTSPVSGVTIPGVLFLDPKDSSGIVTASLREFVSFTTINAQRASGLTRGLGGSTAQSHGAGALVHTGPDTTTWGDMIDYLQTEHDANGKHVISTATINYIDTVQLVGTSTASIAFLNVTSFINNSGASINGFPDNKLTVKFQFTGSLSGATTALQTPMIMPRDGTLDWIAIVTKSVASTASVIFDINKNGTSIFNSGTRPSIVGAGTFISTASIATKAFNEGDQFSWDFDGPSSVGGLITNFNIFIRSL